MTTPQDISRYSVFEKLRDGRVIEIRAITPNDRSQMLDLIGKSSKDSFYRRFFSPKRNLQDSEIDSYFDIDFVNHVALVAVLEEAGQSIITGGGRFIVEKPGTAEIAFGVGDAFQGQGIGSALMRRLVAIARSLGISVLHAEVLSGNTSMLKVFEKSGLAVSRARDFETVHVTLRLQ